MRGTFYTVELQDKGNPLCTACGDHTEGQITEVDGKTEEPPCNSRSIEQVSVKEYAAVLEKAMDHVLLDVREPTNCGIASLPERPGMRLLNISLVGLKGGRLTSTVSEESAAALTRVMEAAKGGTLPIYVLCRRGVDSEPASAFLVENGLDWIGFAWIWLGRA